MKKIQELKRLSQTESEAGKGLRDALNALAREGPSRESLQRMSARLGPLLDAPLPDPGTPAGLGASSSGIKTTSAFLKAAFIASGGAAAIAVATAVVWYSEKQPRTLRFSDAERAVRQTVERKGLESAEQLEQAPFEDQDMPVSPGVDGTSSQVTVHLSGKSAATSPDKPSAPAGPARMLLPVPDEQARGRFSDSKRIAPVLAPVLQDESAAVVVRRADPRERLPSQKSRSTSHGDQQSESRFTRVAAASGIPGESKEIGSERAPEREREVLAESKEIGSERAPEREREVLAEVELNDSQAEGFLEREKRKPQKKRQQEKNVTKVPRKLDEAALLQKARRLLPEQPQAALRLLDEHQQRFGQGMLANEREVLAIETLLSLGRKRQARARAERFRASNPDSIYRRRLEHLFIRHGDGRIW